MGIKSDAAVKYYNTVMDICAKSKDMRHHQYPVLLSAGQCPGGEGPKFLDCPSKYCLTKPRKDFNESKDTAGCEWFGSHGCNIDGPTTMNYENAFLDACRNLKHVTQHK